MEIRQFKFEEDRLIPLNLYRIMVEGKSLSKFSNRDGFKEINFKFRKSKRKINLILKNLTSNV